MYHLTPQQLMEELLKRKKIIELAMTTDELGFMELCELKDELLEIQLELGEIKVCSINDPDCESCSG